VKLLTGYPVRDLRALFEKKARQIDPTPPEQGIFAAKTSVTWHFAGPEVPKAVLISDQAAIDFIYNVYVENHIFRIGADGVQYHLAILPSGTVLQLRDLDRVLWSCGHSKGNRESVHIHFPIGVNEKTWVYQQPSAAQLVAGRSLTAHLGAVFGFPRSETYGHKEWKEKPCPGVPLFNALVAFRTGQAPSPPPVSVYKVTGPGGARIFQGPGTNYKQAGLLQRGVLFESDGDKQETGPGRAPDGENNIWRHMKSGQGFVWSGSVQPA
jgi:hypothetical protein